MENTQTSHEQAIYVREALCDHASRVRDFCFTKAEGISIMEGEHRKKHMEQFVEDASLLVDSLESLVRMVSGINSLSRVNTEQMEAQVEQLQEMIFDHIMELEAYEED